jgi:predicted hydrolase (HD superfamily)
MAAPGAPRDHPRYDPIAAASARCFIGFQLARRRIESGQRPIARPVAAQRSTNAGIPMTTIAYDEARQQLNAWTETESLLKHARAVEIVMREAAPKYGDEGADEETWAITGLLHDADYEKWPDEHPKRIVDWLRERGEEEMAYAVSFHQTKWGLPPKSSLDRALLACDELAGFVIACCLVRPDGIASLTPKSVKKKLKDKAFAAKVDRQIIRQGMELLEVEQGEHIQFVIDALKPHAAELGIEGTGK